MAWDYSEKLMDHFLHPRNAGEIPDANGRGEVGSIACGDALLLTIKVEGPDERITDAKFKTFGCGSAIASASVLTEMVKGKTVKEAEKITNKDIADWLDGIPPEKMHCSVMGQEALEAAIANYRGKKAAPIDKDEGRLICKCYGVTEEKIARAVRENNLKTVEQVTNYTKAGGGCGTCHADIEEIIKRVRADMERAYKPQDRKPRLTNLQRIQTIQKILEEDVRPMLQKDNGDIQLVDINGSEVQVSFVGMCRGCTASDRTIRWVEEKLQEHVDGSIRVVEVEPAEVA